MNYRELQKHMRKAGVAAEEVGGSTWEVSTCKWGGFAGSRFADIGQVKLPEGAKSYIIVRRQALPMQDWISYWLLVHGVYL
ncbi:MAG TPA: hypothetical protein VK934_09690 [Fimbriimonas sp.]|nr:hypothetical protein [Fimbriimonas sp.]